MANKALYGLIGYPLSHSFSKKYFTEKFEREGISAQFVNFEIESIDSYSDLIKSNKNLSGLSVTIPYKETIMSFLDEIDPEAGIIGAVNSVRISEGKSTGFNTDHQGFFQSLKPLLKGDEKRALILGTGGASRAACYALKNNGIDYTVVSRKSKMSGITYEMINEDFVEDHDIIVNCTPLGTFPNVTAFPNIPYDGINSKHIVYDLTYNPEKTVFLQKAEENGATIKNGYEMLKTQAELSWLIWNQ